MVGSAIAFIGFPVHLAKVNTYMTTHQLGGAEFFTGEVIKKLLHKLEQETSIAIYLADIEDGEGNDYYYLCHFVLFKRGWIQDHEEMARVDVPPKFSALVHTLGDDNAHIKRMSARSAKVYSFDESGNTRIKAS
ncbi:hypothetical protein BD410DRAFT_806075 [Rickenella mellea]|uniref:Uncharacterized protein n=1 Tax=Rickenella mellea TaxID=50990 RepID=A0A4Y7PWP8_9AGAM|nr:hypothetical protein BD410DRAFT_806075 [Rickenella mellea]